MINEEVIDADYSIVEEDTVLPDPEVIEETEEGFIEDDHFGKETIEA